ncbi:MAG TPA: methyltransferase domain-containing protein [Gemmataceae bacterium]|nr:methyltransferase domain-containing protein [Gemmataceae bacterium]
MRTSLWLAVGLLAAGPVSPTWAQSPVRIYVAVPADARLEVNGAEVQQTGNVRKLKTPPLAPGQKGQYLFKVSYVHDGVSHSHAHLVTVEGGRDLRLDLTQPAATAALTADAPRIEPVAPPKADPPPVAKVEPPRVEPKLDVPFHETPPKVVTEMLKLAGVGAADTVMDLGCGDGRIVVAAVKEFGAKKGVGVELSADRVRLSKANAEKAGVGDRVEIREADILKIKDVSEASVVALYLLPDINERLKPVLRKTLKPGSRVVSLDFDMGPDWRPDKEVTVKDEAGRDHLLYRWSIPDPTKAEPKKEDARKDPPKKDDTIKVPYVPTPQTVVDEMLKLAGVKDGDVVYDLGCGDGRIVISAVKAFKAKKGVGVDIDPERIRESRQAAKVAGVTDKVEFREGDVLKITDVSEASVVCLYLFPEVNERLQPMLQRTLKPGSRIVSHDFLMKDDFKPDKEIKVKDGEDEHTLYLWVIKEPKK